MPSKIDDRWLWLGFGVFFFVATKGIRYAFQDITELTKLDPIQPSTKRKSVQDASEDTISLENLKLLAEHPNQNISNAAISLIVSRYARLPNATQTLKSDLNSPDEETRNQAKTAVEFLKGWGLPSAWPTIPPSPDPSFDATEITTAELSRRLTEGVGGVAGGSGWAEGMVVPSAEDPVAGWTSVPRERPVDDVGDEEVERRRRRREAMVLHEGSGRVVEGDIIRPRG